ncbi:MAG TPA: hypothetical protein VKZ43_03395 [Trueperaceae bacterium]|nr:hypothetical protein [Trueperaceae bacterium]
MRAPRLLTGYVIRVTVLDNRWHIVLVDIARHSTTTFHDFMDLAAHLELEAARCAVSAGDEPHT